MRRTFSVLAFVTISTVFLSGLTAPGAGAATILDAPGRVAAALPLDQATEDKAKDDKVKFGLPAFRVRELEYALGRLASRDTRGVMPSLYRGKWFVKKAEHLRRCIMMHESHADYRAVSVGGKYRGAYQMNRPLFVGAAWMMIPEVRRDMGPQGVAIVKRLMRMKTHLWPRYWQDRAFWRVWAKGEGRRHWRTTVRGC
ncbi:MAG: hypothetical protein F2793_06790 [Actinobacteria bacterium]|uniref:Unannotated protein n=1 Tax=freshwater metagenome TaxID=449393 RepID=A0A6J7EIF6_9ZZZZ|nr:hypothetical protein [Actinomycetota bacterium]